MKKSCNTSKMAVNDLFKRRNPFCVLRLLPFFMLISFSQSYSKPVVIDSVLGPSKIKIVVPDKWNHRICIFAHGLRAEQMPLTADLSIENKSIKTLIDSGWIIATTSYRRNGWIVLDAAQDIDTLRHFLVRKFGKAEYVFLNGGSMGGEIVTLLSEKAGNEYSGALAIGAALYLDSTNTFYTHSYNPLIPLLFISNQNELAEPKMYISKNTGKIKPGLWEVKRDGHCNLTDDEELAAFEELVTCAINRKPLSSKDGTIIPDKLLSTAKTINGNAYGTIISIHPSYGNISTSIVESDFAKLKIVLGDDFLLKFKEKEFKVKLGKTYSDVPEKEWISFFTADGNLIVARNFASPIDLLGCNRTDTLIFRAIKK